MTKFKGAFAGRERYHELKKKMGLMIGNHKPPEEISEVIDRAYYSGELTLEETQHLLTYVDGLIDGGVIALLSALLPD
jgi:hypothetical protein